ncbi:DUF4349 domain-containing protein [Porphyrobacter sp. YT40]|uniref:DUF4349 domain-containing protein n=1 Tax=Porphyrobacter sp. YT40 TaxID=2547601 RepID=UPI0015E8E881|nr:DUF4349 domain-containing protein [Porphyrobacter sp. YT40]
MRKPLIFFTIAAIALSACSQSESDRSTTDMAQTETAEAASPQAGGDVALLPTLDKIPVNLPQLAYVYDYRWQMPAESIAGLQRRHAALCEQQGPAICQITGMTKTGEADAIIGELQMAVATRQARAFGALIEDEALDAGAQQIAAEIVSEELSKQLVDTEARLASRIALRDRLQDVLRGRKGKVEELIEAERSVAAVNEEIDQARSWLKEMEGRVAYSRVTVHYETGTPVTSDFLGPVTGALGALGSIFGYLVAILILVGSVGLPVAAIWWAARAVERRLANSATNRA